MQEINQKITFSTTGDVDYEKVRTGQIPKEILSEVFDNILEHYDVPRENSHKINIKINTIINSYIFCSLYINTLFVSFSFNESILLNLPSPFSLILVDIFSKLLYFISIP